MSTKRSMPGPIEDEREKGNAKIESGKNCQNGMNVSTHIGSIPIIYSDKTTTKEKASAYGNLMIVNTQETREGIGAYG